MTSALCDPMRIPCASAPAAPQIGFNKACGLVETGEWAAAESELKSALKLGE